MSRPPITVVVPTYRRPVLAKECVRAILEQLDGDDELVVVDDGSEDNTLETLRRIQDPRLSVLSQRNQGSAVARNRGIDAARHDLILFVDDDEVAEVGLVDAHRRAHETAGRRVALGGRRIEVRLRGRIRHIDTDFRVDGPVIPNQGSWSARRSTLDLAGRFDPRYRRAQEVEYLIRLRRAGAEFIAVPAARTKHCIDRGYREFRRQRIQTGTSSAMLRAETGFGLLPRRQELRPPERFLVGAASLNPVLREVLGAAMWGLVRIAGWIGSWRAQSVVAGRITLLFSVTAEERADQQAVSG